MTDTFQRYFGRFTIGTNNQDFTVTDSDNSVPYAVQLTAGEYYLESYSGEGTNQLVEHTQAQIRDLGVKGAVDYGGATVTYNATTDRVTIDFDTLPAASVDITWTDSDLKTLLGFTGAQTGADTYTAAQSPRYVWSPSKCPTDYPLDLAQFWAPNSPTRAGRSKDGSSWSVKGTAVLYDAQISYELLDDSEVITPSTGTIYDDLQQFWVDVVHAGQPVRIYVDRSTSSAANTKTGLWVPGEDDEPLGSFLQTVGRHIRNYNGLWDVDMRFEKYVT